MAINRSYSIYSCSFDHKLDSHSPLLLIILDHLAAVMEMQIPAALSLADIRLREKGTCLPDGGCHCSLLLLTVTHIFEGEGGSGLWLASAALLSNEFVQTGNWLGFSLRCQPQICCVFTCHRGSICVEESKSLLSEKQHPLPLLVSTQPDNQILQKEIQKW